MDSSAENKTLESKATPEHRFYPAFLRVEGKLCVVVGGGRVATRKVRSLLAAGALVRVISEALHPDLQTLLANNLIDSIPARYTAEHLAGANLVFAATNFSEVNRQVAHDAHTRGLWVNVADNPGNSDFYVPAVLSRQNLTVAISTGGEAPAFASYVRDLLERSLSDALGQVLEMATQARPLILAAPEERQASLWESLKVLRLETVIETQGYVVARQLFEQWLEQNIEEGA